MPVTPIGVHLIGSVCGAPTTEASFRKCVSSFPDRLRRLPDGEPAHRSSFIAWQKGVFEHTPAVIRQHDASFNSVPLPEVPEAEVQEIVKSMPPLRPSYDDFALESYAVFKQLRSEGVIPANVRFQVCIPTVTGVMCLIRDGFQAAVEPYYEAGLLRALKRIQDEIPHQDLAIQFDLGTEPMTLEGAYWPHFKPYWPEPLLDGVVERVARLADAVEPGVDLGFHICYGDMGNAHFVEPKDTGLMAEMMGAIRRGVNRPVNWFHIPVPKSRDDQAYYAPLKSADLGSTELYLGLVHAGDEEGTKRRIKVAHEVLGDRVFGVATECGMGRTPVDKFDSIAQICSAVSSPVR